MKRNKSNDGRGRVITSEMIDVGENILIERLGGGVEIFWTPRDLAAEVYEAMSRATL